MSETEIKFQVEFNDLLDLMDDRALPSQQARNDKRVSFSLRQLPRERPCQTS